MSTEVTMEKLTALAKNRGFIYPGSEIYGGLANTRDYCPLGVEFKNNVKDAWRRKFVQESKYNVGLDAAILMNPQTWVASGHVGGFSDPLIDCKQCKARFRADKLIEDYMKEAEGVEEPVVDGWPNEKLESYIQEKGIKCPECGKADFTGIRQFNLMFKTFQGVTEDSQSEIYLRPETAQGIFVNFKNVTDSKGKEDVRTVLRLHPALAPYKAAVLPLAKKLAPVAEPIYEELTKHFSVDYDVTGSIGKRYRREDEIGTPFSICVDFDTETDHCVTIRDRDTMEQIRIPVDQVKEYIEQKLVF